MTCFSCTWALDFFLLNETERIDEIKIGKWGRREEGRVVTFSTSENTSWFALIRATISACAGERINHGQDSNRSQFESLKRSRCLFFPNLLRKRWFVLVRNEWDRDWHLKSIISEQGGMTAMLLANGLGLWDSDSSYLQPTSSTSERQAAREAVCPMPALL